MRTIALESLTLTAFKSFVAETTIDFSVNAGLKFLGGENQAEPRLGANGAGKTTLWDGLTWVLTGASIKGLRASDLVSWGKRRPSGACRLLIDDERFVIERQGSPDKLTIDGSPATQIEVDRLLGMSRGRFLQSVIFGQAVKFFVDLSAPERGALLDEALDLKVWLQASDYAGKLVTAALASIAEWQQTIRFQEGKLAGLPDMALLAEQEAAHDAQVAVRFEAALNRMEAAGALLDEAQAKMGSAQKALDALARDDIEALEDFLKAAGASLADLAVDFRVMTNQSNGLTEHRNFLRDHANCPTCKQKFPEAQRRADLLAAEAKVSGMTKRMGRNGVLTNQINAQVDEARADLAKLTRKRDFLEQQVLNAQREMDRAEATVDAAAAEAERVGFESDNPYSGQLATVREQRAALLNGIDVAKAEQQAEEAKLMGLEYWRAGFKRVRLFMVQRILSHLELEVATAAEFLGLTGWQIKLVTETETKSGGMRQGVQVIVHSPESSATWEAWSGGEGQRVRLAVNLGFATMIQRMSGVDFLFEGWDEPSAWLSPEGIEDLLEALRYRAEISGKSVWLMDHRALIHSGFSEIWKVTKDRQGSRVELVRKFT